MILNPCVKRKYRVTVPKNAYKCTGIYLYTELLPTCFCQTCGRVQGGNIRDRFI